MGLRQSLAAGIALIMILAGVLAPTASDALQGSTDDATVAESNAAGKDLELEMARPGAPSEAPAQPEELRQKALSGTSFFEQNIGQGPDGTTWFLRGNVQAGLTSTGLAAWQMDGTPVRIDVEGATPVDPVVVEARGSFTQIIADDGGVAQHANHLRLPQVLPGVDFDLYVEGGAPEFDLIIAPGIDPESVRLKVTGDTPTIEDGALRVGDLMFAPPVAYQESGLDVPAHFVLDGDKVTIQVGAYNADEELVIDPIFGYATYIPSKRGTYGYNWYNTPADFVERPNGNWIMVGGIASPDGIVTQAINPSCTSCNYGQPTMMEFDQYDNLLYMLVWGRNNNAQEEAHAVALLPDGDVVVSGGCGGVCTFTPVRPTQGNGGSYDAFVARFRYDPSAGMVIPVMMTPVGGSGPEYKPIKIASSADGSYAIAGTTYGCAASTFPVVNSPYGWPTSSYSGSPVCGYKAFVTKWNQNDQVEFSGMPGGTTSYGPGYCPTCTQEYVYEYGLNVGMDDKGAVYFAGMTNAVDFTKDAPATGYHPCPMIGCPGATRGQYDLFFAKLDSKGIMKYASYWGTTGYDSYVRTYGLPMEVPAEDEIIIGGTLYGSAGFDTSQIRPTSKNSGYQGFLTHIDISQNDLIMSFTYGPQTTAQTYMHGLGYQESTGRYTLAGWTYYPQSQWTEFGKWIANGLSPVPQDKAVYYYPVYVFQVDPALYDANLPDDKQAGMIRWASYVDSYYYNYYSPQGTYVSPDGDVYLGGTQYAYYSYYYGYVYGYAWAKQLPYSLPTTSNALANVAHYYYQPWIVRIEKAPPFTVITARDGQTTVSSTAPINAFDTLNTITWTDVWLEGNAYETEAPVDYDSMRWDLDADGDYDDWPLGAGDDARFPPKPINLKTPGSQLVCLRVDDVDTPANKKTGQACMDIVFANRKPVPKIVVLSEEPLNRLDPVWFDSSTSYDLDGAIDPTYTKWDFDGPGIGAGIEGPQPLWTYSTVGAKDVRLTVRDDLGKTATIVKEIEILNLVPAFTCEIEEAVAGAWIELSVSEVTDRDGTIAGSQLDVPGWKTITGEGMPPASIFSSDYTEEVPVEGPTDVTLTVFDDEGGKGICKRMVDIDPGRLIADFAWEQPAWAGFEVPFADDSFTVNGIVIEWDYAFGDGTRSPEQNPIHTFQQPGEYEVTLRAYDGFDEDTVTRTVQVIAPPFAPQVGFSLSPGPYAVDSEISITNETVVGSAEIVSAHWIIEGPDYDKTLAADPYEMTWMWTDRPSPGVYTITLRVRDANGWDVKAVHSIEVKPQEEPSVDFHMSLAEPQVGENVIFTDASTPGVFELIDWQWEFQDGSKLETGKSVTHVFDEAGVYLITMTITDGAGGQWYAQHALTVVGESVDEGLVITGDRTPAPRAAAGPDRSVAEGDVIQLDGTDSFSVVTGDMTYQWTQKAGTQVRMIGADTATPSFTVPFIGTTEVLVFELVVEDAYAVSAPDPIRLFVRDEGDGLGVVDAPVASFGNEVAGVGIVIFDAPMPATPSTFHWDFGDSTTGDGQRIQHRYAELGDYVVTLTVTDQHGRQSTETSTVSLGDDESASVDKAPARSEVMGVPTGQFVLVALLVGAFVLGAAVVAVWRW